MDMSGPQIDHQNIPNDVLSVASRSKPAELEREHAREHTWRPEAAGLYDPSLEKDSCGVGFIANIKGRKSHQIIADALNIL
jgi:glutamate synthase (NADPH) large chain